MKISPKHEVPNILGSIFVSDASYNIAGKRSSLDGDSKAVDLLKNCFSLFPEARGKWVEDGVMKGDMGFIYNFSPLPRKRNKKIP